MRTKKNCKTKYDAKDKGTFVTPKMTVGLQSLDRNCHMANMEKVIKSKNPVSFMRKGTPCLHARRKLQETAKEAQACYMCLSQSHRVSGCDSCYKKCGIGGYSQIRLSWLHHVEDPNKRRGKRYATMCSPKLRSPLGRGRPWKRFTAREPYWIRGVTQSFVLSDWRRPQMWRPNVTWTWDNIDGENSVIVEEVDLQLKGVGKKWNRPRNLCKVIVKRCSLHH